MIPAPLPWHRSQWERIERSVQAARVPHALLLRGAAGTGKALFAARLAAALLCRSSAPPCGVCEACRLCAAGSHPDRFDVTIREDRREIVVDQIRDVVHSVGLTARLGGYKLVIVDPAEQMNRHAANTLLKTLEEPPGATVFLLVSSNHALLLATIRSRCQMVDFPAPERDLAIEWLRENVRSAQEGRGEAQEARAPRPGGADRMPRREGEASVDPATALDLARGAPMRALDLLTRGSIGVRAGLARDVDALLAGSDPMAVASRWKELGRAAVSLWLADILAERLRASVLDRASAGPHRAGPVHFSRLLPVLDRCLEVRGEVQARLNVNEQLVLERLALDIAGAQSGAKR